MSLTSTDLSLVQSASMPADDTTTAGGASTSTVITPTTIGEWFPQILSNVFGGSDLSQFQKVFIHNGHDTDSLGDGRVYIYNGILDLAAGGLISYQFSDTTDATNTTVYAIGRDLSGIPQTESIAISGSTSVVTGVKNFKSGAGGLVAIQLVDSSTGAKKPLVNGTVTITSGAQTLGVLPTGYASAIGFLYLGVVGTQNDTETSTNRLTAPGGISFYKPNSYATGIAIANSGALDAGDSQGIWGKEIAYNGMPNSRDMDVAIVIDGSAT